MLKKQQPSQAFLAPFGASHSTAWRTKYCPSVTRRRSIRPMLPTMGFSMPEIPEVQVPEPKVPMDLITPELAASTAVVSVETAEVVKSYDVTWLDSVLMSRNPLSESHPLAALRISAEESLNDLKAPHRKLEPWRFTELRSVYAARYQKMGASEVSAQSFNVDRYVTSEASFSLVFVDGVLSEELSVINEEAAEKLKKAGGYIGSVKHYNGDIQRLHEMWTQSEMGPSELGGFFPTAGNAVASDAAIIDMPKDFSLDGPISLSYLSSGSATKEQTTLSAPRLAVLAGMGSKFALLEFHASMSSDHDFSLSLNGAAIAVADNANVTHYMVNDSSENAHVLCSLHAVVQSGGTYNMHPINMGGKVGRLSAGIDLEGNASRGSFHGANLADGRSVQDLHSRLRHNAMHTTSSQLQKSVATDRARAVFSGKIIVTENGDGTDSSQLARSLLLSECATIDAMPILEIDTDDVKCSHGATVADLRDEEMFYLRSRGLSYREAQSLLVVGFALEVISDCPMSTVEKIVREKVDSISESSKARSNIAAEYTSM